MSTVFKSRWMALLWAAGIVWCAVDYVGEGDGSGAAGAAAPAPEAQAPAGTDTHLKDASGRPITAEELQELNGGGS